MNFKTIKFNFTAFSAFILLLLIEIDIVLFFKEGFIRHTFGDYLVVILLYNFIRSFVSLKNNQVAYITLLIAFIVELAQLTPLLSILGLESNLFANLVFGNTFSFTDLLAYTLGYFTIIIFNSYSSCKHFLLNKIK